MDTVTIQAIEARQKFGELLERVYYQNKSYRIARKDKPMGWLVGDAFVEQVSRLVDYIIENEPALADTLTILLDADIRETIEQARRDWKDGKRIPLDNVLT